eukprot:156417-Rhodomonas_salina.4
MLGVQALPTRQLSDADKNAELGPDIAGEVDKMEGVEQPMAEFWDGTKTGLYLERNEEMKNSMWYMSVGIAVLRLQDLVA